MFQQPVGMTRIMVSVIAPIIAGVVGLIIAGYIFIRDHRRKKLHVSPQQQTLGPAPLPLIFCTCQHMYARLFFAHPHCPLLPCCVRVQDKYLVGLEKERAATREELTKAKSERAGLLWGKSTHKLTDKEEAEIEEEVEKKCVGPAPGAISPLPLTPAPLPPTRLLGLSCSSSLAHSLGSLPSPTPPLLLLILPDGPQAPR